MKTTIVSLIAGFAFVTSAQAVDLEPTLGKKGKLLFEEKFDSTEVPKGWVKNTGTLAVSEGSLRMEELASEKHAGAFRKALPVQNVAIQLSFKFDKAKMFHLGFDPATGELNKKGHLYSVVVNPKAYSIIEHNDKADPTSKPVTHASKPSEFKDGQWYTMLLENKGEDVVLQISDKELLRAKAEDFRVKKPGLVLRVSAADGDGVFLDNVHVWELD